MFQDQIKIEKKSFVFFLNLKKFIVSAAQNSIFAELKKTNEEIFHRLYANLLK